MADKDNAFRRMLGDKEMFLRFLRRFLRRDMPAVVEDLIESGDFSLDDLILENITFIPPDLREKRSDVVYRIRRGTLEAYVYILIEHQSSVDFLMPYRMLSYMVRLWDRCIEEAGEIARRKSFQLPPIMPVVFYDGERPWTAVKLFTHKVRNTEDFRGYVPDFEYRLISLRDVAANDLLRPGDALGTLLYLAKPFKSENFFEVSERIRKFLLVFPDEEKELLARHLGGYLKMLAKREGLDADSAPEDMFENEEAENMLTYLEKEIRRYKREGREEGLAEGREEGRQEGWREGRQEGRQEGREEGRQEGRQEGREEVLRQTVRRMLASGMAVSLVAEILEFSEERVRQLAGENSD